MCVKGGEKNDGIDTDKESMKKYGKKDVEGNSTFRKYTVKKKYK
jgi:hypothetical protein